MKTPGTDAHLDMGCQRAAAWVGQNAAGSAGTARAAPVSAAREQRLHPLRSAAIVVRRPQNPCTARQATRPPDAQAPEWTARRRTAAI